MSYAQFRVRMNCNFHPGDTSVLREDVEPEFPNVPELTFCRSDLPPRDCSAGRIFAVVAFELPVPQDPRRAPLSEGGNCRYVVFKTFSTGVPPWPAAPEKGAGRCRGTKKPLQVLERLAGSLFDRSRGGTGERTFRSQVLPPMVELLNVPSVPKSCPRGGGRRENYSFQLTMSS